MKKGHTWCLVSFIQMNQSEEWWRCETDGKGGEALDGLVGYFKWRLKSLRERDWKLEVPWLERFTFPVKLWKLEVKNRFTLTRAFVREREIRQYNVRESLREGDSGGRLCIGNSELCCPLCEFLRDRDGGTNKKFYGFFRDFVWEENFCKLRGFFYLYNFLMTQKLCC